MKLPKKYNERNKQLSAAVFPVMSRQMVRQDWASWDRYRPTRCTIIFTDKILNGLNL